MGRASSANLDEQAESGGLARNCREWKSGGVQERSRSFERGIVDGDYFLRPLQYTFIWPARRGAASRKADEGISELLASNVHRVGRKTTSRRSVSFPRGKIFSNSGCRAADGEIGLMN